MQNTQPATAGRGHRISEVVVAVMVALPRTSGCSVMSEPFNTPTVGLWHYESNREALSRQMRCLPAPLSIRTTWFPQDPHRQDPQRPRIWPGPGVRPGFNSDLQRCPDSGLVAVAWAGHD